MLCNWNNFQPQSLWMYYGNTSAVAVEGGLEAWQNATARAIFHCADDAGSTSLNSAVPASHPQYIAAALSAWKS